MTNHDSTRSIYQLVPLRLVTETLASLVVCTIRPWLQMDVQCNFWRFISRDGGTTKTPTAPKGSFSTLKTTSQNLWLPYKGTCCPGSFCGFHWEAFARPGIGQESRGYVSPVFLLDLRSFFHQGADTVDSLQVQQPQFLYKTGIYSSHLAMEKFMYHI